MRRREAYAGDCRWRAGDRRQRGSQRGSHAYALSPGLVAVTRLAERPALQVPSGQAPHEDRMPGRVEVLRAGRSDRVSMSARRETLPLYRISLYSTLTISST